MPFSDGTVVPWRGRPLTVRAQGEALMQDGMSTLPRGAPSMA